MNNNKVLPTLGVLYSEFILTLYPILVRTVPTNLFSQYLSRFLVFPILGILFGGVTDIQKAWGTWEKAIQSICLGGLNLAHVGCSYYAYANLLPGIAISLFYLYPIFNILAGWVLFGEKLSAWIFPILILSFIGTVLVAFSSHHDNSKKITDDKSKPIIKDIGIKYWIAIAAAIGAALTETGIFIFIKKYPKESPFYAVESLYPSGFLGLILANLFYRNKEPFIIDYNWQNWMKLIGFNAIFGFTGYTSRFFSMPRLSSSLFSVLSFIGVLASFMWGIIFLGEKPTIGGFVGGMMIASSIFLLRISV